MTEEKTLQVKIVDNEETTVVDAFIYEISISDYDCYSNIFFLNELESSPEMVLDQVVKCIVWMYRERLEVAKQKNTVVCDFFTLEDITPYMQRIGYTPYTPIKVDILDRTLKYYVNACDDSILQDMALWNINKEIESSKREVKRNDE